MAMKSPLDNDFKVTNTLRDLLFFAYTSMFSQKLTPEIEINIMQRIVRNV